MVPSGDTGCRVVAPGTPVVTAGVEVLPGAVATGVAVLPEVGVATEALDDEEDPSEPEDDVTVSAGVTTSGETMFPLRMVSKVCVVNCVSLHRGFWMATVLPPDPTRVNRMTARDADSMAEIPSVLGMATFACPASLFMFAVTVEPGISLLAVILSIRTMSLS